MDKINYLKKNVYPVDENIINRIYVLYQSFSSILQLYPDYHSDILRGQDTDYSARAVKRSFRENPKVNTPSGYMIFSSQRDGRRR